VNKCLPKSSQQRLDTEAAILVRRHCISVKSRGASHRNRVIGTKASASNGSIGQIV
jgi:hypothetical protein